MNNILLYKIVRHASLATNRSDIGRANYEKHLENCIWNPTIGGIARQQYLNKSQNRFQTANPTAKYLTDILNQRINKEYPKTKKIREYIIKDNRLDLFSIKPAKGFNWLDKLRILTRL